MPLSFLTCLHLYLYMQLRWREYIVCVCMYVYVLREYALTVLKLSKRLLKEFLQRSKLSKMHLVNNRPRDPSQVWGEGPVCWKGKGRGQVCWGGGQGEGPVCWEDRRARGQVWRVHNSLVPSPPPQVLLLEGSPPTRSSS